MFINNSQLMVQTYSLDTVQYTGCLVTFSGDIVTQLYQTTPVQSSQQGGADCWHLLCLSHST